MATKKSPNVTLSTAKDEMDILSKLQKAKGDCKPWHDSIERRRKLYNFDHYDSRAKAGEHRYIDPTYTNTVDLSVGILLGNEMKWHAVKWKKDARAQIESDSMEKFLNGIIEINNFRQEYNIPYEVYKHFTRDGAAVLYSTWDVNYANQSLEYEEEIDEESETGLKKNLVYEEPPILVQVIDPLNMVLSMGGRKRWDMAACYEQVSVYDVEHRFKTILKGYRGMSDLEKQAQKGNLIDYWDIIQVKKTKTLDGVKNDLSYDAPVVRWAVLFEDEFIKSPVVMDDYEDLPYTINFFQPVDRVDPKEWGRSIIDPLIPSVELLERSVNRRQHQIDIFTSLPLLSKTRGGKKLVFDPGMAQNVTHLDADDDVAFPVWPGNAPDVQEQIDFVRARVQQSGFSDVMFGSGNSSGSGYALSQLGDQNRIRLEQPVTHLEMLWTHWAKKVLKLTEEFAEDRKIKVYGRSRGQDYADEISGEGMTGFLVKCEIKPEFPNEKVRNHAMATQVKGILDDATIMENYLGIEQPSDIQDKKIAQQALSNPALMQYAMIKQFRALAQTDSDAAIVLRLLETQLQQAGQANSQGSNPEQLTGTQGANGQATPQAGGMPPPGQGEANMINEMAGTSPGMDGQI
jgi:hypothetical protein